MTYTGTDLINMARRRVDAYGSDTFSNEEIVNYLNMALWELHDVLVNTFGDDYYSSSTTYPLTASLTASVNLSPVPYKVLRVDWLRDDDRWHPMQRVTLAGARLDNVQRDWETVAPMYRSRFSVIDFHPHNVNDETVRVHHVTFMTAIDSGDPSSSVLPDYLEPWHQFLVIAAAIHMVDRIEGDTSVLMNQKGAMLTFIKANRAIDTHGYQTINDVEGYNEVSPEAWRVT